MTEDASEDVLFEGSPLFEYLQETCPKEVFESSIPQRNGCVVTSTSQQLKSKNGPAGWLHSLSSLLIWPWSKLHMFDLREDLRIKQLSCQLKCLSWVTKSGLINETDKSLFVSLENRLKETKKTSRGAAYLHIFTGSVLLLGALTCCFVPHMFQFKLIDPLPVPAKYWFQVIVWIFLFAPSVSVFLNIYRHHHLVSILNNQAKGTDNYIHREQLFLRSFRRSLKYIQEVEVISRGYTMVGAASYSGGIEVSHRLLLPLRKVCLSVITKYTIVLRAATKSLIYNFPVLPEYNLSDDCISNQKLPEWIQSTATNLLGGLTSSQDDEMLSLSTLKILFGLYREQCSDFVHQSVISLVKCDKLQCYERTDLNLLKKWSDILHRCTFDCQEATSRLDESYRLHRWTPSLECIPTAGTVSRREVWKPEVQLITALHSLRLHLETALSKISPIDDELSECDVISVTNSKLSDIKTLVQEIADHIEASQMCYEETKASLEKISSNGNPKRAVVLEKEEDEKMGAAADSHDPVIHLINDSDDNEDEINGNMDEQIFEAYISEKRKVREDEDSEEWFQEKIQRRREAEDAKRLLQELNCVLTKRLKQREMNREEKRLKMSSKGNGQEKSEEKLLGSPSSSEENNIINTAPSLAEQFGKVSLSNQNDSAESLLNLESLKTKSEGLVIDGAESRRDSDFNSEKLNSNSKANSSAIGHVNGGDMGIDGNGVQQSGSRPGFILGCHLRLRDNSFDGKQQNHNIEYSSQTRRLDASEKDDAKAFPDTCTELKDNQSKGDVLENEAVSLSTSSEDELRSKSKNLFETVGESGNPQCIEDFNGLAYDIEDSVRSYESASKSELNEPVSLGQLHDRSYVTGNPWMIPGLAAQVAKISQQQVQLSEDTFGDADSDGE